METDYVSENVIPRPSPGSAASATVAASSLIAMQAQAVTTSDAIRPFRVDVPDELLVDLRRRLVATRWPDRETAPDESQGVQLATMQELARYWGTGYDWRKCEVKLNALPQFMTEIDGLDIHFIHFVPNTKMHYRSSSRTDGPGSVIEQLKIIDPLDQSQQHMARARRTTFHVAVNSLFAGLRLFSQTDHGPVKVPIVRHVPGSC